jgi:hypothetical protein
MDSRDRLSNDELQRYSISSPARMVKKKKKRGGINDIAIALTDTKSSLNCILLDGVIFLFWGSDGMMLMPNDLWSFQEPVLGLNFILGNKFGKGSH